jgi:hypothetical protein
MIITRGENHRNEDKIYESHVMSPRIKPWLCNNEWASNHLRYCLACQLSMWWILPLIISVSYFTSLNTTVQKVIKTWSMCHRFMSCIENSVDHIAMTVWKIPLIILCWIVRQQNKFYKYKPIKYYYLNWLYLLLLHFLSMSWTIFRQSHKYIICYWNVLIWIHICIKNYGISDMSSSNTKL